MMRQDEKDKLLALFADQRRWCQEVEARDAKENPVHYDDKNAAAWDIVGGMCRLFGWQRASELFAQVTSLDKRHKYWTPQRRAMAAMAALIDFNDAPATTHQRVITHLEDVRVTRTKCALERSSRR